MYFEYVSVWVVGIEVVVFGEGYVVEVGCCGEDFVL